MRHWILLNRNMISPELLATILVYISEIVFKLG